MKDPYIKANTLYICTFILHLLTHQGILCFQIKFKYLGKIESVQCVSKFPQCKVLIVEVGYCIGRENINRAYAMHKHNNEYTSHEMTSE